MATWGSVVRAKQGQLVSGDVYVIREYQPGYILASVIDGLGGGEEAARAARAAEQVYAQFSDQPLQELIRRSHAALHGTRGAVVGLLRLELESNAASYVGVGNISIHVYSRQPIKPISKNGILGYRLPNLLEMRYTYDPGDIFVLYSDGISSSFSQDRKIDIKLSPQEMAEQILELYGKYTDDATVVVVKTAAQL